MRVQYYDIARLTLDQEDAIGVRFALFTELFQTSDVVSLHVPARRQHAEHDRRARARR